MTRLALVVDLSVPLSTPHERLQDLYQQCHLAWLGQLLESSAPPVALTLNAWLLNYWVQQGWEEGLARLRSLYDFGKVELLGTASHAAILPLVPESMAFRQVRRQLKLMQQLLHPEWRPAGFYPPALAFGHEISRVLQPLAFQWCLADDTAYAALHGDVPGRNLLRCAGLTVLLASRLWSQRLTQLNLSQAEELARWHQQELSSWLGAEGGHQILALQADLAEPRAVLHFLRAHQRLGTQCCHPSHLLSCLPIHEGDVPPGSALTPVEDFWNGQFFSPWQSQGDMWDLSQQALGALELVQDQLDELIGRGLFDRQPIDEPLRHLIQRLYS